MFSKKNISTFSCEFPSNPDRRLTFVDKDANDPDLDVVVLAVRFLTFRIDFLFYVKLLLFTNPILELLDLKDFIIGKISVDDLHSLMIL